MSRKFLEVFVVGDLNYRSLVRYPSTDGKSGPLTTVLKDNLVICYVPA